MKKYIYLIIYFFLVNCGKSNYFKNNEDCFYNNNESNLYTLVIKNKTSKEIEFSNLNILLNDFGYLIPEVYVLKSDTLFLKENNEVNIIDIITPPKSTKTNTLKVKLSPNTIKLFSFKIDKKIKVIVLNESSKKYYFKQCPEAD